jgi:hypothetical protein
VPRLINRGLEAEVELVQSFQYGKCAHCVFNFTLRSYCLVLLQQSPRKSRYGRFWTMLLQRWWRNTAQMRHRNRCMCVQTLRLQRHSPLLNHEGGELPLPEPQSAGQPRSRREFPFR